jgi:hypothetical protein
MSELALCQEITEGIDVLTEPLRKLSPYGACFLNDRVNRHVRHGVINSSGVHTIGGSYPSFRHDDGVEVRRGSHRITLPHPALPGKYAARLHMVATLHQPPLLYSHEQRTWLNRIERHDQLRR